MSNIHELNQSNYQDLEVPIDDQQAFMDLKMAIAKDRAIGKLPQTQDPFDGPLPTRDPSLDKLQEKGYDLYPDRKGVVFEA